MVRTLSALVLAFLGVLVFSADAEIGTKLIASDFRQPLWAEAPKGSEYLLWVAEKEGTVRILDRRTGQKDDFLDISDRIEIKMNEQGLLGLAFSNDYLKSGRFYVYYTNLKGDSEIARFTAHGEGMRQCDPASGELLLSFEQNARNHNGGWIGIGPDGYLYIASGDGGVGNDPKGHGQDLTTHLGKLLRIDVSPKEGYRVPDDNPFLDHASAKPEIYAYGLRNPWRCSWDRKTGDFYLADVGQGLWEEINLQSAGKGKGANYGWRLREGLIATPKEDVGGEKPAGAIDPIHVYKHGAGNDEGLSITGGYVYRGPIKELQGKYFYADFVNPRVWSFEVKDGKAHRFEDWTEQFQPDEGTLTGIASFGEDHEGNLLIISHAGSIFQVEKR
jgi:glucose/arabinose dehydrogenase